MAYSAVPTVNTGDLWTAANQNTYLKDNMAFLEAKGSGQETMTLHLQDCLLSDDSAGSAAAQIQHKVTSDGTDPQPFWLQALYDADTNEHLYWGFFIPDNYASAPIIHVWYKMATAEVDDVMFSAAWACLTDGDATDLDAIVFDTFNDSAGTTVPGTAGHPDVVAITCTNNDSMSAGDWAILCIRRHADDGADDALNDAEAFGFKFLFTG